MNFKILGLNLDIEWENKAKNFLKIEQHLEGKTADLFLLPEMFSTGFSMNPERIADRNQESLEWMQDFAKRTQTAVAGSVSVMENAKFFNRFYFVKPCGTVDFYDKRHLFSYSGEDQIYTAGTNRQIIEYKGINFLLQICYDLRFPVFSRNLEDYDVALYVANWPEKRIFAWEHLLKARAIENQAFVFGLNRTGTDGNGLFYPESSHCYFADGTEISETENHLISAEIDMEQLKNFRQKFKFLKDRDNFQIG